MKKRVLHVTTCLLLMLSMTTGAVYAQSSGMEGEIGYYSIGLRYANINSISADLSISSAGKATCTTKVRTSTAGVSTKTTMTLQKKSGGVWKDVTSWSYTGEKDERVSFTKYESGNAKGYSYRVQASVSVYDKNGKLLETATVTSATVSY